MTRIFDALKKAEAARSAGSHPPAAAAPAPAFAPHAGPQRLAGPQRPGAETGRAAFPLLGGVPLAEDVAREMTALRVHLEAALGDRTSRVVMFVAPQGGEGTSTVALQFAQTLAGDETCRPLLVDAHVRRPAYEYEPSHRCVTLSPALAPHAPGQAPIVASNLFVVPAPETVRRTAVYQPVEMRQLLDASVSGFGWIVIDGPPVIESPDGAALAALADAVVMVVQAGRTKRPVLTRAADLLRKAGARLLGTVLNRRVLEIPEFIYRRI